MRTIKFILFFLPFIMKAQTVDLLDAITFHNTIRTYQLNPMLEYDSDLSLSAESWANIIIRTGDLIYENNLPNNVGELLYRVDATDEILNYNPYLDATTYWATNGGAHTIGFDSYNSIGMGVAYGKGKVVVVAKYR